MAVTAGHARSGPALAAGLAIAAVLLGPVPAALAQDAAVAGREGYQFGVFPYVPVLTIDRIYGPVAAQFADDLGRPVHLKTKTTFAKFAEQLRNQTYDIILVHPFFYVEARDHLGYLPLARLDEPLTGLVMVREDDPVEQLADLAGGTIALPSTLAAISELIRASLIGIGLAPDVDVALEHFRSKRSCLRAVANGLADACGVPQFALARIDPDNHLELRTMFETPAIKHFVFAVHARVPQADRIHLSESILAWPFTARGRSILAGGAWSRFVPARDEDYDEVRRYIARVQDFAQR